MIKIAICDDNESIVNELSAMLINISTAINKQRRI